MLQLRYAAFQQRGERIPAIIICAEARDEVTKVAELVLRYYEMPGAKPIPRVGFKMGPGDSDSFFYSLPHVANIEIADVDRNIRLSIVKDLAQTSNFLMILGFGEPLRLVSPKLFFLARSALEVDGKLISGALESSANLTELKHEIEKISEFFEAS